MDVKLLTGTELFVVVHPRGDKARLAVRALAGLASSGDVVACDRIAEDREDAEKACAALADRYGLAAEVDPRFHELALIKHTGDEIFYLAVLQGRDLDSVSIAEAQWFDVHDYRLASDEAYPTPEKADAAAAAIAQRYGLVHVPSAHEHSESTYGAG